ncbi:transcriptional regulator [Archaeoglobales archaeon]|nr:MAG: transcriptional regulator [Archaeoglobales archaeon]
MYSTLIVFVGHTKPRLDELIKRMREYPIDRIVLVVGQHKTSGEQKARKIADELKNKLETVFNVRIVEIDQKNVINAAYQLIDLINKEKEKGYDVIVDTSGSLRMFIIAAYIAACATNSKVVSSIPRYEDGKEVGIEEIVEVPTLPLDLPGKEQMEIISAIDDGVDSLDDLILKLNPEIKRESEEFKKERSRLSHHIAKLVDKKIVTKQKIGRNVKIRLTPLGSILKETL